MKPIAIYYPEIFNININDSDSLEINERNLIFNKSYLISKIRNAVDLAKSHGIYGFGIYYQFFSKSKDLNKEVNIITKNKYINFPFFLIWKINNFIDFINDSKSNFSSYGKLLEFELDKFVKHIKIYLKSKLYIKYNKKPILSIDHPLNMTHLKSTILILRRKMIQNKIGEIFILSPIFNEYNNSQNKYLFDGQYDQSRFDLFESDYKKRNISYYSGMIYKNIIKSNISSKPLLFVCSTLERENKILKYYSPEKYYLLNKVIINWTEKNFDATNGIFFIDSWNNLKKGNYLEPDKNFGYSSLNSFSKALFNLPFKENFYNFIYLKNSKIIAVQVHLFYVDLLNEIINKTNNIPLKFDLFITINIPFQKKYIEENLKKYSKADKYEIKIVENIGRDVLPFLSQMKYKIKKYKYICHIHTKKSEHNPVLGNEWRKYLFENLLGNKNIISEIIYDFELNDKLGIIFPDTYYKNIKGEINIESSNFRYHLPNIIYMNFVLNYLFGNVKIGEKLIFPNGDMFWAKVKAIYQIFKFNYKGKYPKENKQINGTIMHAIERIWLYLVKLNGYYYKIIFKTY